MTDKCKKAKEHMDEDMVTKAKGGKNFSKGAMKHAMDMMKKGGKK